MKKILYIAVALALLLFAVACTTSDTEDEANIGGEAIKHKDPNVECYANNDCGVSKTTRTCQGNEACLSWTTNACNIPGKLDSYCSSAHGEECKPCENGCKDGFCV